MVTRDPTSEDMGLLRSNRQNFASPKALAIRGGHHDRHGSGIPGMPQFFPFLSLGFLARVRPTLSPTAASQARTRAKKRNLSARLTECLRTAPRNP